MAWLTGKKTYITAGCVFLIAGASAVETYVQTGAVNLQPVIEAGIALAMIFLRSGIAEFATTATVK